VKRGKAQSQTRRSVSNGNKSMSKTLKVLVTGGAGFIGSHLVDGLVNKGCTVRIIDNLSTGNLANIKAHIDAGKISFVKGDIRDASLVDRTVKGIDAVFHLAAQTSVPFSIENPQLTHEVNVAGTSNLLASSAKHRADKFLYVSSCAVYGEPRYLPVDEQHPTCPISPYAESKLAGERQCLRFHKRQLLRTVVLRLFNVYGPRQGLNDYTGAITRFIERAGKNKSPIVFGDGLQTRDFVHVRDVVDAAVASAEEPRAVGQVLNIGSGKPTSVNELAEIILKLSNAKMAISHEAPRPGDIKNSYADISKAKKLIGYNPKVSLMDGLRSLLHEKPSHAKAK
jgi:UDP-glucose 4-epimerase